MACECLRDHPIWNNYDRELVFDAIQTCERYAPHHRNGRSR
jgi:hypothetical protein